MSMLPEVRLDLCPRSPEAKRSIGFKWNVEAGGRCKLGGEPDWIQEPERPACCGSPMVFYGQLDSIGDDFMLADCGMIFVFVCFDCYGTKSILQSA